MSGVTQPTPSRTNADFNRWLVLVIACLAQFMVVLDTTIVNVALPSIQRGLHFSPANLQWVVNAYTLIFGGFLLLGGRAADLLGRKTAVHRRRDRCSPAASLLNGLAQSSTMLIVGRGLQGLGGALVSPAALSIITTTFTDQAERTTRARRLERDRGRRRRRRAAARRRPDRPRLVALDLLRQRPGRRLHRSCSRCATCRVAGRRRTAASTSRGAVTVTGGLAGARVRDRQGAGVGLGIGQDDRRARARASLLLAAFVVIERRSAAPLMRLDLPRPVAGGRATRSMLLVASGMFGMFFFASLYVQEILGYSPLQAGLAFLPVDGRDRGRRGHRPAADQAARGAERVGSRHRDRRRRHGLC